MKASVYTEYGPPEVLQIKEVEKPVPKDNEILIRIHATSVNYGDLIARNFKNVSMNEFNMPGPLWLPVRFYFGFNKPKVNILGAELSGQVETVGKDVTRFRKGDQVFGYPGQSMGAYAEYLCMDENACVAAKPEKMSYEEAAVVPYGALMAFGLLRKMDLQPGQKVLVLGASGGIGSAAVQLAKNLYGTEVTGVCSTPRIEFVKALGADHVVDYTREDFTQNGETYDLILDILGRGGFARIKNSLKSNGRYLLASFKMKPLLRMLWTAFFSDRKVICALSSDTVEDLIKIKELIEAGKIKAIIDKIFTLEEAGQAHRYVEDGHKKGHIAIRV